LIADKAYDSREFRKALRRRGIKASIPTFEHRKRLKPRRGRPIRPGIVYCHRWITKHCLAWIDNCRRLTVCYEHHLQGYKAFCLLALILWATNRILE
jgi:transposase